LPADHRLTTRVCLNGADGRRREVTVTHPKGVGSRRLTNVEVVAKYRALTSPLLDGDRQAAIEEAVLGIDGLPDLQTLTDLLTPTVPSAVD
jgi:hypothetical protein